MIAINNHNFGVVKLLVEKGASLWMKNLTGEKFHCLELALKKGDKRIVDYLVGKMDLKSMDENSVNSILQHAANYGSLR